MTQFTEIAGAGGKPPEPVWRAYLNDEIQIEAAQTYWREIVNEMTEAGTLAVVNGHSILRLVLFKIEFDTAAQNVAENGKVQRAKRTAVPQISPHWTCMKQASEAVMALESELGLSPRRRSGASKVNRAKRKTTAADGYLRSVPK